MNPADIAKILNEDVNVNNGIMENWMGVSPDIKRWLQDGRSDKCEHVDANPSVAYAVQTEDDSFGPVGRYIICKACYDDSKAAEGNRTVICHDCKQPKLAMNTINWKWYDFYDEQGDEPIIVCNDCMKGPAHKQRVQEDRRDREREDQDNRDYDEDPAGMRDKWEDDRRHGLGMKP